MKVFIIIIVFVVIGYFGYQFYTDPYMESDSVYNTFVKLTVLTNNPTFCDLIFFDQNRKGIRLPKEEVKEFCRAEHAIDVNKVTLCKDLSTTSSMPDNETPHNICVLGMAQALHDVGLCNQLVLTGLPAEQDVVRRECVQNSL